MTSPKFRHPRDMNNRGEREVLSVRVRIETKEKLEEFSKKYKLTTSDLVSNVLDDYVAWVASQETSAKR